MTLQNKSLLWLVFFLICMGLGYPPLNRYDPGKLDGTSDVTMYRKMVEGHAPQPVAGKSEGPAQLAQPANYSRMLVPYVAKPFYWLARGHLRTWDAALFGLLIANSIFTATTACLLVAIGYRLTLSYSTSILGGSLYLLNFCVTNLNLVGLVDSAEGCFLLVIVWSLLDGRWILLPIWGVCGALAKETFAPLAAMFVFGWWIAEVRRGRLQLRQAALAVALVAASMTTVTVSMSRAAGGRVWPWQFASYMDAGIGFLNGLRGCILNHTFLYVFVWLLPLGLVRLLRLPWSWVVASGVAFCGALVLGAYSSAYGNASRALYSVAGPILSLSTAVYLGESRPGADAVPERHPARNS